MIDYKGLRFDKLLVIENLGKNKWGYCNWKCLCDCGNEVVRESFYFARNKDSVKCCKECAKKQKIIKWQNSVNSCPNKKVNIYDITSNKEYGIGFTEGKYSCKFIFDKSDYEKIKNYRWIRNKRGYIYSTSFEKGSKRVLLHQFITGNKFVDHINKDKLDNRRCNLRKCNSSQNGLNRQKTNKPSKVKYVGVSILNNTYVSYITINYKRISKKSKDLTSALLKRLIMEYLYCDGFCSQPELIKKFLIKQFCQEHNINNCNKEDILTYLTWINNNNYKIYEENGVVKIKQGE